MGARRYYLTIRYGQPKGRDRMNYAAKCLKRGDMATSYSHRDDPATVRALRRGWAQMQAMGFEARQIHVDYDGTPLGPLTYLPDWKRDEHRMRCGDACRTVWENERGEQATDEHFALAVA